MSTANVLPVQVGTHIHKDVDISTENKKQPTMVDGTCTGSSPGEPHNVGSTAIHLLI